MTTCRLCFPTTADEGILSVEPVSKTAPGTGLGTEGTGPLKSEQRAPRSHDQ